MIRVRELMNSPPITCRPEDTLDQAARLMWDHDCGVVVVVSQEGRLVGVITDRDVCMAGYTRGQPLREIQVGDAMAKEVFSCQGADPISRALKLMGNYQVRRLPVVNADNRPVGLISLNNLIRYSAWSDDRLRLELLKTMEDISQPRWLETDPRPLQAHPARHSSGFFEKYGSHEAARASSGRQS